jgi:hypothetical protein
MIITRILLTLFVVNMAALFVGSIAWRNKEITFGSFFVTGTFIYRDLPKYIKQEKTTAYMVLSYSGLAVFMLLVLSMILLGTP